MNKKILFLTLKNSGFTSPGDFGLRTSLFGGIFLSVQNAIVYVFLVVIDGAEFKFACINT